MKRSPTSANTKRASKQKESQARSLQKQFAALVPTSWLDSLLSGPEKVLRGKGGTWGCPDIERLLLAIRKRILAFTPK